MFISSPRQTQQKGALAQLWDFLKFVFEGKKLNLEWKLRILKWSNFQLNVKRNLGLRWFCFTPLYDWFRKLALLPQPIRCKIKTNDDLVTRIFPRFTQFACFFFGSYWFSRYSLFPDGPFRKLWFLFYENHLKRAQIAEVNKTKYTTQIENKMLNCRIIANKSFSAE